MKIDEENRLKSKDIQLTDKATKELEEHTESIKSRSITMAKILAYKSKQEIVIQNNVKQAIRKISYNPNPLKQLALLLGGILFGAFTQGYILSITLNQKINIIYSLVGITSELLIIYGVSK